MAYSIEYQREGRVLGSEPWPGTLQEAIAHAQDEMKSQCAESARIMDTDGNGDEVWFGQNDALGA